MTCADHVDPATSLASLNRITVKNGSDGPIMRDLPDVVVRPGVGRWSCRPCPSASTHSTMETESRRRCSRTARTMQLAEPSQRLARHLDDHLARSEVRHGSRLRGLSLAARVAVVLHAFRVGLRVEPRGASDASVQLEGSDYGTRRDKGAFEIEFDGFRAALVLTDGGAQSAQLAHDERVPERRSREG